MKRTTLAGQRGPLVSFALRGLGEVLVVWMFCFPSLGGPRQVLSGHVPSAVGSHSAVGRLAGSNRLDLAIGLPLRHQAELGQLLSQISNPARPHYRHYLAPAQFTERFGPPEGDYQALVEFVTAHHLLITQRHPNRMVLDVRGAVTDIEQTFHVTLRTYQHPTESRLFFAPEADPWVELEVPILTVGGLNNYTLPRPMSLRFLPSDRATPQSGSGGLGSYMGNDFRAAYVPGTSLTGAGQTVGLLEFEAGFNTNDIIAYESLAGLPNVPVQAVLLDGYNGAPGGFGPNSECSLDIEMAISMAPGLAGVLVYEGSTTDDLLNQMATDDLAKQIGSSWSYATDATSEQIFQEMAVQGQSFFNASGDNAAYASSQSVPTPAGDTNITIVGGTTLTTTGPAGSWVSETVWNSGYVLSKQKDVGSSGGIGPNAIPPWQEGLSMTLNNGSTNNRNLPDVALAADNIEVISDNGLQGIASGTSCAAPLWAGFTALVNEQAAAAGMPSVGFLNPAIYALGKGTNYTNLFHDITAGNNTNSSSPNLYYACAGYDLCTGWGTPAGTNLVNALALAPPPPPDILLGGAAYSAIGGFLFEASNADGTPITTAELFHLRLYVTTNPIAVLSDWVPLTNGMLLTNGFLQINDPDSAAWAERFYRAVWTP